MLNPAISRRHTVLPIGYDAQGRLMLAMADPGNVFALDDVRQITGSEPRPIVATRDDLLAAIERYCRADADMEDITSAMSTPTSSRTSSPRSARSSRKHRSSST